MQIFEFGPLHVSLNRWGQEVETADLRLHIQCRWRLVDAELTVHPGSGHAFMAPHNALGTQDQDLYDQIWPQATAFLHEQLG